METKIGKIVKRILISILLLFFIGGFLFININVYFNNKEINNFVLKLKNNINIFEKKGIIKNKKFCIKDDFSCYDFIKIEELIKKKGYKINDKDILKYADRNSNSDLIDNLKNKNSIIKKLDINTMNNIKNNIKKEDCLKEKNITKDICKKLLLNIESYKNKIKSYHGFTNENERDKLMIKYFKLKKELFINYQNKLKTYFLIK